LTTINLDIDKLKIDIQEAKHEVLLKLFAAIYQTRTKMMIKQTTEQKIQEGFESIESGLNDLFARSSPSKLREMFGRTTQTAQQS